MIKVGRGGLKSDVGVGKVSAQYLYRPRRSCTSDDGWFQGPRPCSIVPRRDPRQTTVDKDGEPIFCLKLFRDVHPRCYGVTARGQERAANSGLSRRWRWRVTPQEQETPLTCMCLQINIMTTTVAMLRQASLQHSSLNLHHSSRPIPTFDPHPTNERTKACLPT